MQSTQSSEYGGTVDHMMSGDLSCDGHLETSSFWRDFWNLIVNLCDEVAIATGEKPILEIIIYSKVHYYLSVAMDTTHSLIQHKESNLKMKVGVFLILLWQQAPPTPERSSLPVEMKSSRRPGVPVAISTPSWRALIWSFALSPPTNSSCLWFRTAALSNTPRLGCG